MKRKMMRRPQQPPRPKEPETEKEILDRIYELEYRRLILRVPQNQRVYLSIIQDNITNEIKRLYDKLESLKKNGKTEKKTDI